jgi:AcrR family transcriptional regulator
MVYCSDRISRYPGLMDDAVGLRERKKRRTREQIVDAAMRLFAERGYGATTIADIAAAADIAPRTFFAYFPSKEAVVFHDSDEDFASLKATLEQRPEDVSAFVALRNWIDDHLVERWSADQDESILRKRLCLQSEELSRVQHHLFARFEDLLREAVARDLGQPPDSLRPRLVAAATSAAVRSLDDDPETEPATHAHAIEVLDEALVFLQGGIEALQRHEPAAR